MCGITAIFDPSRRFAGKAIAAMTASIAHRGPDDEGFALFDGQRITCHFGPDTPREVIDSAEWRGLTPLDADGHGAGDALVALGHRRLSIIDLSPMGHQPMSGPGGRHWLIFNGEIYNFVEIRAELEALGHVFRSHSDSEVLIAAWRQWGEECLHRFNGMFAFVLLDMDRRLLFAARDRFAVKPLYLWRAPDGFLALASEIKAFTTLPGWRARLDDQGAYDFLNWGLTDHRTSTMFADVVQLSGGECLTLPLDAPLPGAPPTRRWYTPRPASVTADFPTASREFAALFRDAVRLRLRADVRVGTGLSGGLDSSSIVCTMAELLREAGVEPGTQHSFSACAEDPRFDERVHIDKVVAHTGVANHRCFPDLDALFADLPRLAWHQDEPFGSASIFAEWSVFGLVQREQVKVTLDGHGADELLYGYTVHHGAALSTLIRSGRWIAALGEARGQMREQGHGMGGVLRLLADPLLPGWARDRLRAAAGKTVLRPAWLAPELMGRGVADPFAASGGRGETLAGLGLSQLTATSLPMQLHWCDRDSMAHGVESRAPFLDYRLVEFLLGCPDDFKIAGGWTKRILRRGLADTLPPAIAARRDKMGFVTPESDWVRRVAPDRFQALVRQAVADCPGILTPAAADLAGRVIRGEVPYNAMVWRIVSFAAWMRAFGVTRAG